ncbi:nitroreductase family protein [Candidatus Woesearchaeota archaeon]|nr:nitroreductase family protein [Candidatus Woesearchaeota archaeon]
MHKKEELLSALEAIRSRRSIRKYLDLPIEFEKVGRILDAGRLAPSAGNLQPWKFILVIAPEQRGEIAEACLQQFWMMQAPVHIVVCVEPKKSERYYGKRGEELYALLDGGCAIENMLLAAHAQHLGACAVSAFDEAMLRRACNIPDNIEPIAVITVGYADEKPVAPLKFELHNLVFFHNYGNRVKDEAEVFATYSTHVSKALQTARKWAENVLKRTQK